MPATLRRLATSLVLALAAMPAAEAQPEPAPAPPPRPAEAAAPVPPAEPGPPPGKTLAPVFDPRCSLIMPTLQTYKEVPTDAANAPPKCGPDMR